MRITNGLISALAAVLLSAACWAQTPRAQYIEKYKSLALESQEKYGIPASIKMAQAILESADGTSRLAVLGNNHFGIKCKSYWTGQTISHDDDAQGECFRKYSTAEESFEDHSKFLSEGERYAFLFSYDVNDYAAWAHGLKQAGYATNPQYAYLLIKLIEDNQLYALDRVVEPEIVDVVEAEPAVVAPVAPARPAFNINDYAVYGKQRGSHSVYLNNNSRFVVMFEGETLESLSEDIKVLTKRLRRYNDLKANQTIEPGEMVYVKSKKKYAHNGTQYHVVKGAETLHSVSQLYGIRLEKLCEINKKTSDMELPIGMRLRLK